jgi:hypothetical protein
MAAGTGALQTMEGASAMRGVQLLNFSLHGMRIVPCVEKPSIPRYHGL